MKTAGCLDCHEVDKKKVGPAFKEISAKYKGKKAEEVMESHEEQAGPQGADGEDQRRSRSRACRVDLDAVKAGSLPIKFEE